MSKNIDQVYMTNPITTNAGTDLMYFGQSPYGVGDDAAMKFSDFVAQLPGGVTQAQVQHSAFNVGIDSGVADHYVVSLTPALTAYTDGLLVSFSPLNANTISMPDININGLGAIPISIIGTGLSLAVGDMLAGVVCLLQYSSTLNQFSLLNPVNSFANEGEVATGTRYFTSDDIGVAANAYVADIVVISTDYPNQNFSPIILVLRNIANSNTGASTLQVMNSGVGPFPITSPQGGALTGGEMLAGKSYFLFFDATFNQFTLLNSSAGGSGVTAAQVQQSAFNFGTDTGSADHYIVNLSPAVVTLTPGLVVSFIPLAVNLTSTPDLNVNGTGAIGIVLFGTGNPPTIPLNQGDIFSGNICNCVYDGTNWVLLNPNYSAVTYSNLQQGLYLSAVDAGSLNTYVWNNPNLATFSPSYGTMVVLTLVDTGNNGASTLNVAGSGPLPIVTPDGNALVGGEIRSNGAYLFVASDIAGFCFVLLNSSLSGATAQQVQQSAFNVGTDSGTSSAYVVTLSPAPSAYTDGMLVAFKPQHTNTTFTPTINVNGVGPAGIARNGTTSSCAIGDINSFSICYLQYNAQTSAFNLLNPIISDAYAGDVFSGNNFWTAADSGVANAYAVSLAITAAYADINLDPIFVVMTSVANSNTGASTLTITGDGNAPWNIVTTNGMPLSGGEILSGRSYLLFFDQGEYVLLNPSVITNFVTAPTLQSQNFSLSIGTAFQNNTIGCDGIFTVYLSVSAATAASVLLGVGPTSTPTQQTIISGLTLAAVDVISIPIYIPKNWYALLSTSGTITASISGQIAVPI